ncbi:MAG: thrombospondin type-1 domain-containing protein [Bdellovibrionales bacterium]
MSIIRKTGIGFLFLFTIWGCSDSEFSSDGCANAEDCTEIIEQGIKSWDMGEWSRCSLACGGGQKTRTVQCKSASGVVVPDSECSGTKPATSTSCNSGACVADYSWNVGPYGSCSKTCGGGAKYRNVTCQSKEGIFVAESFCTTTKPDTSEACNTDACPADTFNWTPGTWGSCSKTCGGGTYSRSVTCQNGLGVIVDDSYCTAVKPDSNGSCNTHSCSYNYTWVNGSWGTCSKTCGGGTQSRSLGCRRDDGVYVPHTLCSAPAPNTTRACNTQVCPPTCTTHQINETVPASRNQLDVLIVVDDSGSMYQDNARLAAKLNGFTNSLNASNVDWQMCVTTTDVDYFQGRPVNWQGANSGHILKRNSGNLGAIFRDTMRWIGAGFSSDEQAIKAINLSLRDNNRSNCYRQNAGLAVIIISDEDERSVGGVRALNPLQYKPLGADNKPASVMNTVSAVFGAGKRVSVHPIIVKDAQCKAAQDAQGEMSFYGTKYKQLYNRIGGSLHSICQPDFSTSLARCHTAIMSSLGTLKLSCTPQDTPTVLVNGASYAPYITVVGDEVIFNPVVDGPATITGSYCCQ